MGARRSNKSGSACDSLAGDGALAVANFSFCPVNRIQVQQQFARIKKKSVTAGRRHQRAGRTRFPAFCDPAFTGFVTRTISR
jgi:hypothetical protein